MDEANEMKKLGNISQKIEGYSQALDHFADEYISNAKAEYCNEYNGVKKASFSLLTDVVYKNIEITCFEGTNTENNEDDFDESDPYIPHSSLMIDNDCNSE